MVTGCQLGEYVQEWVGQYKEDSTSALAKLLTFLVHVSTQSQAFLVGEVLCYAHSDGKSWQACYLELAALLMTLTSAGKRITTPGD